MMRTASASASSLILWLLWISPSQSSLAFNNPSCNNGRSIKSNLCYSASDLLYQDQQDAKARGAAEEERLLGDNIKPLLALNIKQVPVKSGSGFGAGKQDTRSPAKRLAVQQAKHLKKDGVMRINNTLDDVICDRLRRHILRQQELADIVTAKNLDVSEDYYGVENRRKNRCDLLLSLVPDEDDSEGEGDDVILDVLQQVLGERGTLRPIYEELVSNDGEFYEFAGIITNPGSDRQQIHPDLPHRKKAPLYVIFLALQDITEEMGPTTFLLGTHTKKERDKFDNHQLKKEQLANANSRLALLKKGDAVLFDARILHCGNANEEEGGSTRVMFNFSFRNPKEGGNLGYCGSMRPGYVGKMSLGGVGAALAEHDNGVSSPFAIYGNGLS